MSKLVVLLLDLESQILNHGLDIRWPSESLLLSHGSLSLFFVVKLPWLEKWHSFVKLSISCLHFLLDLHLPDFLSRSGLVQVLCVDDVPLVESWVVQLSHLDDFGILVQCWVDFDSWR